MDLNFPFMEMNSEQVSFEGFQKNWRIPIAGWFLMENPIKMGWFSGTPIFGTQPKCGIVIYIYTYIKIGLSWSKNCESLLNSHQFGGFPHVELQFPFLDG